MFTVFGMTRPGNRTTGLLVSGRTLYHKDTELVNVLNPSVVLNKLIGCREALVSIKTWLMCPLPRPCDVCPSVRPSTHHLVRLYENNIKPGAAANRA